MSDEKETKVASQMKQRIKSGFFKIFAFFGIIVSSGKRHPIHLSALFFIWVAGFIALTFLGGIGMYAYSTHPSFCNSCHIMEPYYEAWETSKHYGKANCVDCHYPPAETFGDHIWHKFQASAQVVKYLTKTYASKPFAEIEDSACLRSGCHSTRLLEGKVVSKEGIKFDHRPHLMETRRGRKLRCVSCHSQIVVGNHVEVTYSTCYLCHFRSAGEKTDLKPIRGCLGCHNLPKNSFQLGNMVYNHEDFVTKREVSCKNCHLDIIQGHGRADKDRCVACHNRPESLARYGDIPFIHENHVTKHHVACLHCHQEMRHGLQSEMAKLPKFNEPIILKEDSPKEPSPAMAFDCSFCHEHKHAGQLEMYTGKVESLGLPEMPSPMYLANVDCIGCHYDEEEDLTETEFMGATVVAVAQSCVKCHGPNFEGIWDETEAALKKTLGQMEGKLKKARLAIEKTTLPSNDQEKVRGMLQKAERWQRFVRFSRGEHNIYLASVALQKEDKVLSEVGKVLGVALPDLGSLPLLSGGFCGSMCHSKVGADVPPETVTSFMGEMPHKMHTTMMKCNKCHTLGAHKEAPLRQGAEDSVCGSCH